MSALRDGAHSHRPFEERGKIRAGQDVNSLVYSVEFRFAYWLENYRRTHPFYENKMVAIIESFFSIMVKKYTGNGRADGLLLI